MNTCLRGQKCNYTVINQSDSSRRNSADFIFVCMQVYQTLLLLRMWGSGSESNIWFTHINCTTPSNSYLPLPLLSSSSSSLLPSLYSTPPRFKSAGVTDQRVRIMNEVISGIRVIKMYAWEYAFRGIVTKLRRWVNKTEFQFLSTESMVYVWVQIPWILNGWSDGRRALKLLTFSIFTAHCRLAFNHMPVL